MISVIVPVYNVQDYLPRCINSLIGQKYTDIEIILIDDGSTDESLAICEYYAGLDNRIKVIHKENGGLSDARNVGLQNVNGEYISFIDSDDWVSSFFLLRLYETMKSENLDIVECNKIVTDQSNILDSEELKDNSKCKMYNTTHALRLLIEDQIFHQTVWNKLYKKEVIDGILFNIGKYNEDEFWTYQVFGNAKKIGYIDDSLYYYFQRRTSLMGVGYNLRRLDAIEAKVQRQFYIEKNFPELKEISETNLLYSIIYAGQMSLYYLSRIDQVVALNKLSYVVKHIFVPERRKFVGKKKHTMWCWFALVYLKGTCKLRNFFHINI